MRVVVFYFVLFYILKYSLKHTEHSTMDFQGLFSTAADTEPHQEAPLSHAAPNLQQPVLGRNGGLMG